MPQTVYGVMTHLAGSQDWKNLVRFFVRFLKRHIDVGAMGLGILINVFLLMQLHSHLTHLQFFGDRLGYRLGKKSQLFYLVGYRTHTQIWSERNSELDYPLETYDSDETGSILVHANPLQSNRQALTVTAKEWILSENVSGRMFSQNIPPDNPSLAQATITLDRQGYIIKRTGHLSTRLGRSLSNVLPAFPKGIHRKGDQWIEPIEWVESIDQWKIYWQGRRYWTVDKFVTHDSNPSVHLSYQIQLIPGLWEAPAWAQGHINGISSNSTGHGEVFFDMAKKEITYHSLTYSGTLILPISNVQYIPRKIRKRRVAPGPGTIHIQFQDNVDIRNPS